MKVLFPISLYATAIFLLLQPQAAEHFYLRHALYVCLLALTAQAVTDFRRWWHER